MEHLQCVTEPRRVFRPFLAALTVAATVFVVNVGGAPAHAVTFVVDDVAGGGPIDGVCATPCTLQEAIQESNALAGPDVIQFALPASTTIPVTFQLLVTDEVRIEGLTQPGATAAVPLVALDGSGFISGNALLQFDPGSEGSTVDGLILGADAGLNGGHGSIFVQADNVTVSNSRLGFQPDGVTASEAPNQVTAQAAGFRLVDSIVGNAVTGVILSGDSSVVTGNRIGIDSTGAAAPIAYGFYITGNDGQIGTAAAGNLIAGIGQPGIADVAGIRIQSGLRTTVQGNHIGVGVDLLTPLGGNTSGQRILGIDIRAADAQIGGPAVADGNIITSPVAIRVNSVAGDFRNNNLGVAADGVTPIDGVETGFSLLHVIDSSFVENVVRAQFTGVTATGDDNHRNVFTGNRFGVGRDGTTPIAGLRQAISMNGDDNRFGGPAVADANVISNTQLSSILAGDNTVVQGNYVGTDLTGLVDLGNASGGLQVFGDGVDVEGNLISGNTNTGLLVRGTPGGAQSRVAVNTIGLASDGTTMSNDFGLALGSGTFAVGEPGLGNVVSGNTISGISHDGTADITIQSNTIGLDPTGAIARPNGVGISVFQRGAGAHLIGGPAAGEGNLVSGNSGVGIALDAHPDGTFDIVDNIIGADIGGTVALGNGDRGVIVGGGTGSVVNNVIVASGNHGLQTNNRDGLHTVTGNTIGVDRAGNPLPNTGRGIDVVGTGPAMIGGAGVGNHIAHNGDDGIAVIAPAAGVVISQNSIHDNGGLGIDLGADGITANDADDVDTGANELQNFPELSGATTIAGGVNVTGSLRSMPDTTYQIEVFATGPEVGTHGEGDEFLGTFPATTNLLGAVSFAQDVAAPALGGTEISMTATGPSGTSEFSNTIAMPNIAPTASAGGPYTADEGERVTLDSSGSADGDGQVATIRWDLDNNGTFEFVERPDAQNGAADTPPVVTAPNGAITVTVEVCDERGLCSTQATTVTGTPLATTTTTTTTTTSTTLAPTTVAVTTAAPATTSAPVTPPPTVPTTPAPPTADLPATGSGLGAAWIAMLVLLAGVGLTALTRRRPRTASPSSQGRS